MSRGAWDEAEAAFRELLAIRRRVPGEDHPSILASRHTLSTVVGEQGRWAQAEASLEDQRRVPGDDHPSTLRTRPSLRALEPESLGLRGSDFAASIEEAEESATRRLTPAGSEDLRAETETGAQLAGGDRFNPPAFPHCRS